MTIPNPVRIMALTAFVAVAAAACRLESTQARGAQSEEDDFHTRVDEILDLSAAAWNGGDLDGFMVHYERAPTTTYIGGNGLVEGYDGIHARYAPLFEPGATRDSLDFESLRTRELGQRYGLATARYVLSREGRPTASGPFTLVLMSVEGAWKIIHDQSASDPPTADGGAETEPGAGPSG